MSVLRMSFVASALFVASMSSGASAQVASCQTKYHTSSQMSGESPGFLSTSANTPCQLTRHIGGRAKGKAPGRAGGIAIVQPPRNGQVRVAGPSSLVFTPKPGFSGSDEMLVRFIYAGGSSGLVRFAVAVQ